MKIKVIPEEMYTLIIDDKPAPGFKRTSSWHGLTRYERGQQSVIIREEVGLGKAFADLFQTAGHDENEVVLISQNLIRQNCGPEVGKP